MKGRKIKHRINKESHGPITHLVRPYDYGDLIKPFVLIDAFKAPESSDSRSFGWHPHSGIATISLLLKGQAWAEETTGKKYELYEGSLELMIAGGGVWHSGGTRNIETEGYQIWITLPPEMEEMEPSSYYLQNNDFQYDGSAKVLLGNYGNVISKKEPIHNLTLLDVELEKGEIWEFNPPKEHSILWVAMHSGSVNTGEEIKEEEFVIFEELDTSVTFTAQSKARFIVGSAEKISHQLVTGRSSIHTNKESLERSEVKINKIYSDLVKQGKL